MAFDWLDVTSYLCSLVTFGLDGTVVGLLKPSESADRNPQEELSTNYPHSHSRLRYVCWVNSGGRHDGRSCCDSCCCDCFLLVMLLERDSGSSQRDLY